MRHLTGVEKRRCCRSGGLALALGIAAVLCAQPRKSQDPGWPRQVSSNGQRLVYYQPQIEEWTDSRVLDATIAVVVTPSGQKPAPGMLKIAAQTDTDMETRTVHISQIQIGDARFPSLDDAASQQMLAVANSLLPKADMTISLDRMLASVKRGEAKPIDLSNDPPPIFVSTEPAILLITDGPVIRAPVKDSQFETAVNANWDLFYDSFSKTYFLFANPRWLSAKDLAGSWQVVAAPPAGLNALVKASASLTSGATGAASRVFYSDKPAALLEFTGKPAYSNIPGTRLEYATDTDDHVFIDQTDNQFYVLLSGRWYRGDSLRGPWTFASPSLPADFKKIPATSPASAVLASVPGTADAEEAVLQAQIPTVATVNKKEAAAKLNVLYDGEPKFQPIAETQLSYAVNTQDKVIRDGDLYYLCFQGVWFLSSDPSGPWQTVDSIAQAIYQIPPSSPLHNVTYVQIYDSTPTTVTCGYTSGYTGEFIFGMAAGAALMYGTGWYYPPYVAWGAYPVYWGYPRTYGVGVQYNAFTGGYYAHSGVYGPYGMAGRSAWYNPATGAYGRAATAQTWAGGRTAAAGYNPWTGTGYATRQGHNAYAQWGSSAVTRGGQTAYAGHVTTAGGTSGYVRGANNNLYAAHDGSVYRNQGGSWQKYDSGGWNNVGSNVQSRSSADRAMSQSMGLSQEMDGRFRGAARTNEFQRFQGFGGRGFGGFRRR